MLPIAGYILVCESGSVLVCILRNLPTLVVVGLSPLQLFNDVGQMVVERDEMNPRFQVCVKELLQVGDLPQDCGVGIHVRHRAGGGSRSSIHLRA